MSVIENVAVPESLLKKVREFSEKEGITVDQFVSSAIAEKASAWATVEYLKERANRGSREKFLKALSKVPKVEPDEDDRID
ncbi:MAG: toxin-antitoxin system HicB family antitoxin [Acidobacteriota bacterium]|nr:toxin-antitoxin system HicB family antitoxin [Acidobacteriota bacterium]